MVSSADGMRPQNRRRIEERQRLETETENRIEACSHDDDSLSRISVSVRAAARAIGFDAVGICDLGPIERQALARWLASGYGATMGYMHRQAARRARPERIAPGCVRAVVVLKNYFQGGGQAPGAGKVARYAWGEDYHRVLGEMLSRLRAALVALGSDPARTRWFVDAGAVPERELAQRAGLGWIAKNTMLIHPRLGSFTFIGTVLTTLQLPVDPPLATEQCGSCTRCLEACPTHAFPEPWTLDARRCISYLTIERRGPFAPAEGDLIGEWLFGCDICQDVCPWNIKFAPLTDESRFGARPAVTDADPAALTQLSAAAFARTYGDTAFERPGATGIARNARQVLVNRARRGSPPPRRSREN